MSLKRHLRGLGLSVLVLASAALTSSAQAQAVAGVARAAAPPRKGSSVRGEIGIALAQRLLASDDLATRLRGIERLGGIGTSEAIDALVDAMDQSSVPARDPHARLVAVRVLAGEARRDKVRLYLLREVTEAGGSDALRAQQPLAALVRSTAALALARSGDRKALGNLVGLAQQSQGDLWSDVALHALRAYPSASLDPFLEGRKRLTPGLAMLLGDLGDLRAIDRLRAVLVDGDQAGKVAAALALAKLGDPAGLALARDWAKRNDPRLRRAAVDVLLTLDVPEEADAAIAALLDSDSGREEGLRLALAAPSTGLAPALRKLLGTSTGDQRARVIAALGRVGAVAPLVPLLDSTETATLAAFAIATAPGREARDAIERLVAQATAPSATTTPKADQRATELPAAAKRRLALRAGVVRALVLGETVRGLKDGLRALFASTAPALDGVTDRAAGAFGLVALGDLAIDDVLRKTCTPPAKEGGPWTCDAVARSAARGALALPDGVASLAALLPWLARVVASDPWSPNGDVVAFGAGLLAAPAAVDVPTPTLAAWSEVGGPLSALAARALGARDDGPSSSEVEGSSVRLRIRRLLESSDPVVRAHVALGLARDPQPSAVSLLTTAYRFEDDVAVRRAIVRALSVRTESQRMATLTLARDLDPDDETRALARRALAGTLLDLTARPALGVEPRLRVGWITIESTNGDAAEGLARKARLARADGLVLPVVADPDGILLVPGLPPGPVSLLVSRAEERAAAPR